MRKTTIAVAGLVLLSYILSIYFYPQVPEHMAIHWDSQGEVNGYMSKFWGLFFTPVVITGIAALFLVIPRIDPKKENIEKFRKYYDGFVILFLLFMVANKRILKVIFLSFAVIVGISVLLQHVHYSIDVFTAPFFSYTSVKFAAYIKKSYQLK